MSLIRLRVIPRIVNSVQYQKATISFTQFRNKSVLGPKDSKNKKDEDSWNTIVIDSKKVNKTKSKWEKLKIFLQFNSSKRVYEHETLILPGYL